MVPPVRRAPLRSPAQWLNRVLLAFVGTTRGARGDGLIDAPRSRLDGARHVEFGDVVHGITFGPWYGDREVIERWWPAAVEAWQAALAARGRAGEADVPHADEVSPTAEAPRAEEASHAADTSRAA
jgi:hypothetical protein